MKISAFSIILTSKLGKTLNYSFDYEYHGRKFAAGHANVWIKVQLIGDTWRVISFNESVQRRK